MREIGLISPINSQYKLKLFFKRKGKKKKASEGKRDNGYLSISINKKTNIIVKSK